MSNIDTTKKLHDIVYGCDEDGISSSINDDILNEIKKKYDLSDDLTLDDLRYGLQYHADMKFNDLIYQLVKDYDDRKDEDQSFIEFVGDKIEEEKDIDSIFDRLSNAINESIKIDPLPNTLFTVLNAFYTITDRLELISKVANHKELNSISKSDTHDLAEAVKPLMKVVRRFNKEELKTIRVEMRNLDKSYTNVSDECDSIIEYGTAYRSYILLNMISDSLVIKDREDIYIVISDKINVTKSHVDECMQKLQNSVKITDEVMTALKDISTFMSTVVDGTGLGEAYSAAYTIKRIYNKFKNPFDK